MEDKDSLLLENEAKILSLEGDVFDNFEKLRNANSFAYKLGIRVTDYKEWTREAKELAIPLQDQIILLKEQMSSYLTRCRLWKHSVLKIIEVGWTLWQIA